MCGRYVSPELAVLQREYRADLNTQVGLTDAQERAYEQSYNVAPTQFVPVVRVLRNQEGVREAVLMRWGLIPYWAKGVPPKYPTINCTIENMETAATWRDAWKRGQRCVVPCAGFYEWKVLEDGKTKQPYFIKPSATETFAFAALWDQSTATSGEKILSCAVLTMPANEIMRDIHNNKQRMPAILEHTDIEVWLSGTPEQARAALKSYPSDEMITWPVSTRVNAPKNNSADLIAPVQAA
jgi:putative SOS response-associated peptidase YedK